MFENTVSKMLGTKRGSSLVGGIVVAIVAGAIGFYVVVKLLGGLDRTGFSTEQNTTFDQYNTNTNTAFVLIALLAIVLASSAILSALS